MKFKKGKILKFFNENITKKADISLQIFNMMVWWNWKKYYSVNKNSMQDKINALKKDLDEDSIVLIDAIIRRCRSKFIMILCLWFPKIFKPTSFYTEREMVNQSEIKEFVAKKTSILKDYKYNIVVPEGYPVSNIIFYSHYGINFLPQVVQEQIKGKDGIDCGAYWGDSTLVFRELDPRKIYAYEPEPKNFNKLEKTIELNKLQDTIISINKALSDKCGTMNLHSNKYDEFNDTASLSLSFQDKSEVVQVSTIDKEVEKYNICPRFIKMDIEGSEFSAIKGAENTIREFSPILYICIYHTPQDFFDIKPFIEKINPNYKFMVRKLSPFTLFTQTLLIGYVGK